MSDVQPYSADNYDSADLSYAELTDLADNIGFLTIPGLTLVDQLDLLGVPFYVTGVRFQSPIPDKSKECGWRDYVSLECTVADEATLNDQLKRGRVLRTTGKNATSFQDIDELAVRPNERIVVNDGSTGIRRQVVSILDHPKMGLITVGHLDVERRYDMPWNLWESAGDQTWVSGDNILPYFTRRNDGKPLLINSRRGLYGSEFSNEYGDATTFYLR